MWERAFLLEYVLYYFSVSGYTGRLEYYLFRIMYLEGEGRACERGMHCRHCINCYVPLAGSVTIYAKTTVLGSPDSSMGRGWQVIETFRLPPDFNYRAVCLPLRVLH